MQRAPAIKIKVYFRKTTYKHLILNDHHFNHHQVEVMTINHLSYVKQGFFLKKKTQNKRNCHCNYNKNL